MRGAWRSQGGEEKVVTGEGEEGVTIYIDGSRAGGVAAGASGTRGVYLGKYATVIDAEQIGILIGWQDSEGAVALDSKGAIARTVALQYEQPRGWIEEAQRENSPWRLRASFASLREIL